MKGTYWIVTLVFLCIQPGIDRLEGQENNNSEFFEELDRYVEEAINEWHVPGLAIGIVKDTNVIYLKGYGFRDLEAKLPVDENTLFPIASLTKAFTSCAFGQLVDEGKAGLDIPVKEYLPDFRMYDQYVTDHLTSRDILCHRSGLPRHDFVLTGRSLPLDEVYHILPYLQFSAGFRESFQYTNILYYVTGYMIGAITGQSWDKIISDQILRPLNMASTFFSIDDIAKTGNYSQPYSVNSGEVNDIPFTRNDDCPAFGMISNVKDMANWLIMNLNNGKYRDKQIVSGDYLVQAHSVQMAIPGPEPFPNPGESFTAGYGLGWYINVYRGHKVVRHSGQVNGFQADVYLLPNQSIGIVVLSNGQTILPGSLCNEIADRLLGLESMDWSSFTYQRFTAALSYWLENMAGRKDSILNEQPSEDELKRYAGTYTHPAYGPLYISATDSILVVKKGTIEFRFGYKKPDIFTALNGEIQGRTMKFHPDENGQIEKLSINLEWGIPESEFTWTGND